ncbi:MAG: hypothetical protein HC898_00905 [Phycisphaerales bacterium]|nr:hypothetical protein [Phycisphaerales bacterium]
MFYPWQQVMFLSNQVKLSDHGHDQSETGGVFAQMAELMQVLGIDSFKVIAMQRAARTLEELADDIALIAADPAKLSAIPGVGKGTAGRIVEYLSTGAIKDHQELLAQVPSGVIELLNVPGLGPKTVALLWKQAAITSMAELKTTLAGNPQKLLDLPGMGEKKLDNLRKNLEIVAAASQRKRLGKVYPVARWLCAHLSELPQVKQAQFAGSLRRSRETVGDLDLLVAAQPGAGKMTSSASCRGLSHYSQGMSRCWGWVTPSVRCVPMMACRSICGWWKPDHSGLPFYTLQAPRNTTFRCVREPSTKVTSSMNMACIRVKSSLPGPRKLKFMKPLDWRTSPRSCAKAVMS